MVSKEAASEAKRMQSRARWGDGDSLNNSMKQSIKLERSEWLSMFVEQNWETSELRSESVINGRVLDSCSWMCK